MTPHQTPPSVTDEMVEAAAASLYRLTGNPFKAAWDTLSDFEKSRSRVKAKAILTAALAAMPGGVDEPELKKLIREYLTDTFNDPYNARQFEKDVLLEGCVAVKYVDPEDAADNFATMLAQAILSRLTPWKRTLSGQTIRRTTHD